MDIYSQCNTKANVDNPNLKPLLNQEEFEQNKAKLYQVQKQLHDEELKRHNAMRHKPKNAFTDYEIRALTTYGKDPKAWSEFDKKIVLEFCRNVEGDMAFNRRLRATLTNKGYLASLGIKESSLGDFREFTYRTQDMAKLQIAASKLEVIERELSVETPGDINQGTKLTLDEIGALDSYLSCNTVYKIQGIVDGAEKKIADAEMNMHHLFGYITEHYDSQPGDIIMEVASRYHALEQHLNLKTISKLQDVLTPYSHAGVAGVKGEEGFDDEETKALFHVSVEFQFEEHSGFDMLKTSTTFRVNVSNLVDSKMMDKISTSLGLTKEQAAQKLNDMYVEQSKIMQKRFNDHKEEFPALLEAKLSDLQNKKGELLKKVSEDLSALNDKKNVKLQRLDEKYKDRQSDPNLEEEYNREKASIEARYKRVELRYENKKERIEAACKRIGEKYERDLTKNIINDWDKRSRAGVADFIPFGHRRKTAVKVGDKVKKMEVRDWAKAVLEGKDNDLVERIRDPKTGDYIICSEFAAKMTAVILMAVEQELVEKMKEKDPNFKAPEGGVIKMPFHKNEDLGRVHPARLVNILQKAGAIEAVDNSAVFYRFIKEEDKHKTKADKVQAERAKKETNPHRGM